MQAINSQQVNWKDPLVISYRENAKLIHQRIEEQFIQAVKDINVFAKKQGSPYRIVYYRDEASYKEGVPYGKEFDEFTSFRIGIAENFQMDYDALFEKRPSILSLGKIHPFFGNPKELKEQAQLGNISRFDEIYHHWHQVLSNDLAFMNQYPNQVLAKKEEITQLFKRVIEDIDEFVTMNNLKPIVIDHQGNSNEPLSKHTVHAVRPMNERSTFYEFIGLVSIVTKDQFKKMIIQPQAQNYEELYQRCYNELKEMVWKANENKFSALAHAIFQDCKHLSFSLLNYFTGFDLNKG